MRSKKIIAKLIMAGLALATTSCSHEHVFDIKNDGPQHIAEEGSCNSLTKYYYSCECGKNGNDIFTLDGDGFKHTYGEYVSNLDATCQNEGTLSAVCEKCGYKNTITNEGSLQKHAMEINRGHYRDGDPYLNYYCFCKCCLCVYVNYCPVKIVNEKDKNDGQNYEYLYEWSDEKQDFVLFNKSLIVKSSTDIKEKHNYSLINGEWVIDSKSIIKKENGKTIQEEIYRKNPNDDSFRLDTTIDFKDNPANFLDTEKTTVYEYLDEGLKVTTYNVFMKTSELFYPPVTTSSFSLNESQLVKKNIFYFEAPRLKCVETIRYENGTYLPLKKSVSIIGIFNDFFLYECSYSNEIGKYIVEDDLEWEYSFCYETRTETLVLTKKIYGIVVEKTKTINLYNENYEIISMENYIFDEANNSWVLS